MPLTRICVIGIDGGASSTRAAIIDKELNVIAQALGGPADHFSADGGRERLKQSLEEATLPLVDHLARNPDLKLEAVCLGLTGASIPGKRPVAMAILTAVFPGMPIFIEIDPVAAQAGAHAGKDGVVVISGTGSVAYGRYGDREARKGGFGYLLGDEGGGFKIALAAISAALQDADDRGPATSLTTAIPPFFGVERIRQVTGKVYAEDIEVDEIAALCPIVSREAATGDAEAIRILAEAGRDLGKLAVSTLRGLGNETLPVSHAGGVFHAGEFLLGPFRDYILSQAPGTEIVPPAYTPLIGAGILAWEKLSST